MEDAPDREVNEPEFRRDGEYSSTLIARSSVRSMSESLQVRLPNDFSPLYPALGNCKAHSAGGDMSSHTVGKWNYEPSTIHPSISHP